MFWDVVSGVYDLFGTRYNRKVNHRMCQVVALQLSPADRVLECACGTGMISTAVAGRCKALTATDYSRGMLRQARKKCAGLSNVQMEAADILSLPYPDQSFDAVIAANVIHLLDEPYRALSELDRVCRPGGKLIIPTYVNNEKTGHTSGFARVVCRAGADFKRQFTFSNYRSFFEAAGYGQIQTVNIPGRVPCAVAVITKPGREAGRAACQDSYSGR